MAKFITSNELNAELEKLFESAKEELLLISPFVKLHPRFESALNQQITNNKLKITIVFGKNENNPARSIAVSDIEFFKKFPNIEIRYNKRLHAKYYANENSAIITSMNLYSFSQDTNIESGVLMTPPYVPGLAKKLSGSGSLDEQAWSYFFRVVDESELLYLKVPRFENTMFGLSKKYTDSIIEKDTLSTFFLKEKKTSNPKEDPGYCIVTGEKITFNVEKPLSKEAYKVWAKDKNVNFKGAYCHFSGERGETSFNKPVLPKNWKKMQEAIK